MFVYKETASQKFDNLRKWRLLERVVIEPTQMLGNK